MIFYHNFLSGEGGEGVQFIPGHLIYEKRNILMQNDGSKFVYGHCCLRYVIICEFWHRFMWIVANNLLD